MTANNQSELAQLIAKLADSSLQKQLLLQINAVKLSQNHSTVQYYLQDASDQNRFVTAWTYAAEYVSDNPKKKECYKNIINDLFKDKNSVGLSIDLISCVNKIKNKQLKYDIIEYLDSVVRKQDNTNKQ